MGRSENPRELIISQSHFGTLLLAALIGFVVTCLVGAVLSALILQLASWASWLYCLFLPGVCVVLLVGYFLFDWGERTLPRLWPSGRRMLLDLESLTLVQRGRVKSLIQWEKPFSTQRWRVRGKDAAPGSVPSLGRIFLACQFTQDRHTISVFTACSIQEWRRVPGWKQFALLEGVRRRQDAFLGSPVAQPASGSEAAPTRRGVGFLAQADPTVLWTAEHRRQREGWVLDFDDFCALMAVVERFAATQEQDG